MDTYTFLFILTIIVGTAIGLYRLYHISHPVTYGHRHRYGDDIGGYYLHTHWYANPHTHYTVAQCRADVRGDPFISAVEEMT